MQPSSATAGEEQIEKDDVDVYVSPRRFVGHTPGPKVTKQRVFEDNQRRKNSAKKDDVGLSIESVKYHADKSGEGKASSPLKRSCSLGR